MKTINALRLKLISVWVLAKQIKLFGLCCKPFLDFRFEQH